METRPALFTFDIFGTVIDWREGLVEAARTQRVAVSDREFEALIDHQARSEAGPYRSYTEILAQSLVEVLRMEHDAALAIAARAGRWPLFPDSPDALRRLMRIAPCVAMTNSDQAHGRQVEEQLGFRLSGWICAEEVRCYKPAPGFWSSVSARRDVPPGPTWWHVSAYADYDLTAASWFGLTTVFVERPHSRWGPSAHACRGLLAVAELAERLR